MKKSLEIVSSHGNAAANDKAFWASQSPRARLQHALELRRINYGTHRVSSRLQRVLEITQRPPRHGAEDLIVVFEDLRGN